MNNTLRYILSVMIIPMIFSSVGYSASSKQTNSSITNTKQSISTLIKRAVDENQMDVTIPAGTYTVGPEAIAIPENMSIKSSGSATIIKLVEGTGSVFLPGKGSSITGIHIDGSKGKSGGVGDGVIMLNPGSSGVTIDSVSFVGSPRTCIVTDHADNTTIRNCRFTNIFQAISIQFSNEIKILNNTVINAKSHGIQF
ncbi:MAG: right-handed parallel beta-helix repeat-containing protein, partial [Armatimonadota bacterium]